MYKTIQKGLNKHFDAKLETDGLWGPASRMALFSVSQIPNHWPESRKQIAFIQLYAVLEGIEGGPVDGLMGAQTQYALEILKGGPKIWRVEESGGEVNGTWPLQKTRTLNEFYGPVGKNMSKVNSPYTLRLAWDINKKLNRFTAHEKCVPSIERVLTKALEHYGLHEIQTLGLDLWGGCLNVRKMRGGSNYSTHSWGCAIDWDPARNRLKWKSDTANFANPEYNAWFDFWEDEGWISLGREKNYDWMHVQAARIR